MSIKPTFQGEVQLAGWSESHNGGCKVAFWLADSADLDAFRALTVRKGNTAGQRLACVLVEIGDDEQPVQQQPAARPEAPKGGALARLAGQWCQDYEFQQWLWGANANSRELAEAWGDMHQRCLRNTMELHEACAEVVRRACGVQSRAELDSNPAAAERFQRLVRRPYMQHCGVAA